MKYFLGRKLAVLAIAGSVFAAPLAVSTPASAAPASPARVVGYVKIDSKVYAVRADRRLVGPGRFQGMTQTQVARHMHARQVLAVKASGQGAMTVMLPSFLFGTILSGEEADILPGNALPIKNIPLGTEVHNIELRPGKGGQLVRSAGNAAQLLAMSDVDGGLIGGASLKAEDFATIVAAAK